MTRRSESTIRGIPRASNVTPVTEIGGDIDDGTKSRYVSIIEMKPSSPLSTKADMISTTISKTR